MRALPLQSRGSDAPSRGRADEVSDDGRIPEVPPLSIRSPYLTLSRSYLRWCVGMLAWSVLCVGYFALTRQPWELFIGVGLGLLLLANVVFPATFFGGSTWHKRLGWITVLTCLFAVLFVYPLVVVALGIHSRYESGRYLGRPYFSDLWHLGLSVMTVGMSIWTARLAVRSTRLTSRLHRGDF